MRFNPVERLGVNAVERIIIEELRWIFREQPLVDVGLDAIIEAVFNGIPSCKFIASQIKSGKGNFHEKEKCWTYYASDIHYNYWQNSNLPVILIAYIPEESSAYWVSIESKNFIRNKRQWRIDIPKKQKLNVHSERRLLALFNYSNYPIEEEWSVEKIEELNEKVKNISKSAQVIHDLLLHFKNLRLASELANEKYRILADKNLGLRSAQAKLVTLELTNSIKSILTPAEELIHEFSGLFAIGIAAFEEIVNGCVKYSLDNILEEILPKVQNFPVSAKNAINQIEGFKQTVEKFTKDDRDLYETSLMLAEVLSLIIREFKEATSLTEKIEQTIINKLY